MKPTLETKMRTMTAMATCKEVTLEVGSSKWKNTEKQVGVGVVVVVIVEASMDVARIRIV
jgi:hypothetical protein